LGLQRLREAEQLARRLGMARLIIDIDAVLHSTDGFAESLNVSAENLRAVVDINTLVIELAGELRPESRPS
jgi:hypothetical protein